MSLDLRGCGRRAARHPVSGTHSESGCRCRRVRAGLQVSRRVIGSQSSARSAHRPSSRVACDPVPAPARGPGQPLGVLVTIETLARRDIPKRSFASSVRPSTIDHQAAGPAAPKRAPEVPPAIGELLRAEHDALHPARPHALRRAGVGRSSCSGHPDETDEHQGSSDDRGTRGELSGTPLQAIVVAIIDLTIMSRRPAAVAWCAHHAPGAESGAGATAPCCRLVRPVASMALP